MTQKIRLSLARSLSVATLFSYAVLASSSLADIKAVDNSVPTTMNGGGTEADPAEYILGSTGALVRDMYSSLYIGETNSFNRLKIQNGSDIKGGTGFVGHGAASANNSVTVTGVNSKWGVAGNLFVGYSGTSNSLTIEDGGVVELDKDYEGTFYVGYNLGSNANSVLVRGTGSTLNVGGRQSITIGAEGDSNSFRVEDGAHVTAWALAVGHGNSNISNRGKNNSMVITGSGSVVQTTGYNTATVGYFSSGNTMTVEKGGVFIGQGDTYSTTFYVGSGNTNVRANNNTLRVTDAGSSVSAQRFLIGSHGNGNSLIIENGASAEATYDDGYTYTTITTGSLGYGNSMVVSGSGSSFTGSVRVGEYGYDNTLLIENGGTVTGINGAVGGDQKSYNNSATVSGTGSSWVLSGGLIVASGTSNSITIEKGAIVTSGSGQIGYNGRNSSVLVKGEGSSWSSSGKLEIGAFSEGHSMQIEDGAKVTTGSASIGTGNSGGKNNFVSISGEGSAWTNLGNLALGNYGSGNTVTISDGALFTLEGTLAINTNGGTNNFIRLNGGFFAWQGDQRDALGDLIDGGFFQVWQDGAWIGASLEGFSTSFFETDGAAFDFTGYHDLGGYTILAAVPEPGTWALLFSSVIVIAPLIWQRRKQSRQAA